MTDSRLSFSSMSYKIKDDVRVLNSCLSEWFSNPKILNLVSPTMRYPFKIKQWINQSYSNQSNTLVLKLDSWIIGHISFRINEHKKSAHIFHLIIDPSHKHKGYGRKLISYAEKLIIRSNLKKITINVLINNQIARNFYENNGFTIYRHSKSGRIKMQKNVGRV
tara:strand:- start:1659 stop:2150 length:492 start_codon:yes stop_codon:yes gene_type:complete